MVCPDCRKRRKAKEGEKGWTTIGGRSVLFLSLPREVRTFRSEPKLSIAAHLPRPLHRFAPHGGDGLPGSVFSFLRSGGHGGISGEGSERITLKATPAPAVTKST